MEIKKIIRFITMTSVDRGLQTTVREQVSVGLPKDG